MTRGSGTLGVQGIALTRGCTVEPTFICGKSYYQAMMYAKSRKIPAAKWVYVSDPDRLRGLRGSEVELIALPDSPSDVLQQARLNEVTIKYERTEYS